ncbi:hypothetical protein LJB90_00260 [Eubacteriales bacterium OttesenSCG-928-G02]|nr:hypothetical protein [Eubacteriales bacterium OttesenSCG-928-G02]
MRLKRIILLLLCLVFVAAALVSCKDDGTNSNQTNSTNNSADESANTSEPEVPEYILPSISDKYKGRTFTILTSGVNATYHSEIIPVEGNELHNETVAFPDRIDEAIQNRNKTILDEYGITIKEKYFHDTGRHGNATLNYVRTACLNNDTEEFQAINVCLYDAGVLLLDNYLYDLNTLDNIKMSNPWWDQSVNENVSILGKQFFMVGDIGTGNKAATPVVLFNKTVADKLNLGNLYDMVADGTWTVDKATELCKTSQWAEDLNNDTIINYEDNFCWGGQFDDMYSMFFGAGNKILTQNAQGLPELTFYSEKASDSVDKILGLMKDPTIYVCANDYFGVVQWPTELIRDAFIAGRGLFYSASISAAMEMSDMQDEFGILPVPKYDENQDEYHSLINTWVSNAFGIAVNADKETAEFAAAVYDIMGYYSWKGLGTGYLATEYYEVVLKYQGLEGKEDALKVLDQIFAARGCELGSVFKLGSSTKGATINEILSDMISTNAVGQLSSKYQTYEDVIKQDLEKALEFFNS